MLIDKNYTITHCHTSYSFLDGFNNPKAAAKRAKELNMTALAITDHNHLGGVLEFQKACKDEGIKPILGIEAYWTRDTSILSLPVEIRNEMAINAAMAAGVTIPETKGSKKPKKSDIAELVAPYEYDTKQYHIILLATSQKGWQNLTKLQSLSAEKCTYNGRYLCDDKMLEQYNEDIIMTTACISNTAADLFIKGRTEEATEQLNKWHTIFGDRFYVEIQPLNIEKQWIANVHLISWAKQKGVNTIATTDVHYTLKADHDDHDTLLCIGIGKTKQDEERIRYSNDFWIKSFDEMVESFEEQIESMEEADFPGKSLFNKEDYRRDVLLAIYNTNIIADQCEEIELGSDKPLFPAIEVPYGFTPEEWLTVKCYRELYKYKKENPDIELNKYEARVAEELNIINSKGFAPYMLIVEEYIDWANKNDCPTGPGRGSAAGSLVLFLLGITKMIDPIKYNLLFFRFLTADRTAPPDVDTDFDYDNRYKVIEHLEEIYGKECVAHIGTYTYMGVKSSLKDVGRVLHIDFNIMNEITKKIDEILDKPSVKFKHFDILAESENTNERLKYKEFRALEKANSELFRLARRFEGTPRNMGVHASGILITPMPINELMPTRKDNSGAIVTLYTGVQLEDLNFLKFDVLGLKTISIIKNTLRMIDANLTFDNFYRALDVDDPEMYKMIREKETDGLFQIESNLFKGMIEDIKPDSLNDIIVINALK